MKYLIFTLSLLVAVQMTYGQSNAVKRYLKEQEEQQKKEFPIPLAIPYPTGTLGEKIQTLYEIQAKEACGIIRSDKRLFIPREIVSGYGESRLRSTLIYDVPISATNLLFLVLSPSDVTKLTNGTFNEQESIAS